jgi:hypothetical protein
VIGGATQPAVQGPSCRPAPNGTNAIVNTSLETDPNANGVPDCFLIDSWGSQTYTWTRTSDAQTGSFGGTFTVYNNSSGDDKLIQVEDLGPCAPTVVPGHQYRITECYESSAPVYFVFFNRDSNWSWSFWTGSPSFPPPQPGRRRAG